MPIPRCSTSCSMFARSRTLRPGRSSFQTISTSRGLSTANEPCDEKSISHARIGVACVLRAVAREPVDLDRQPTEGGSRGNQLKRKIGGGGGEKTRALSDA